MDNPYETPEYNEETPPLWETEFVDVAGLGFVIAAVLAGLLMIASLQGAISFLTS